MSTAAIVTLGYGTPGSAARVVTLGYAIGEADLTSGAIPGCRLVAQPDVTRLRAQPDVTRLVAVSAPAGRVH